MNEQEQAQEYLEKYVDNSFLVEKKSISKIDKNNSRYEDFDLYMLEKNQEIIELADECLLERLKNNDFTIKSSDIINAKETAFKQIRSIKGIDDWENRQLIPATINIQVINNY